MTENRKLFKGADLLIIIFFCIIAVFIGNIYLRSDNAVVCEIMFEGTIAKAVDLSENTVFSIEQKPNVLFEVRNNAIAFIESDCPDKICVRSGFLKHNGQSAACLPNMLLIRISGENVYRNEADTITY